MRLTTEGYKELRPWSKGHPNLSGNDLACPTCASTNVQARGQQKTLTMAYRRYQCQECGAWFRDVKAAHRHANVTGIAA